MKIFIDTSAFIAVSVEKEITHKAMLKVYSGLRSSKARFYTSDYILDEFFTRISYDEGATALASIMALTDLSIKDGSMSLLRVTEDIFTESKQILAKYAKLKLSFTDATSFILCKKLKLDHILTLDEDFRKLRMSVVSI